jgi:hypothetical protein
MEYTEKCKMVIPGRIAHSFKEFKSYLCILGARWVTSSKFHIEDPQFSCDHPTSLLSGTFSLVHVNWYTFCMQGENVS